MFNRKSIASISLTLSIVLMTPSVVSAAKLSDFVMSTTTSAGSWSDPLGGGTYLSGGDFTMRLKSTSSHAPLFDFKLPSASVGCSGISISGGFISFLGLDKLQNLLSTAGSSLMFGIILGLEFTLPAISAVFAKIRAWANALQKMLQNGCNIGKTIAAGSALGKSMHSDWLDKKIKDTFPDLDKFISEGEPQLLKEIEKLGNCNGDINSSDCTLLVSSKVAAAKAIKNKMAKILAANISANLISKATQKANSMKEVAVAFKLSDFYVNKKITCPSVNTNSITDTDILIDQLKYLFFGDIAVDEDSVKSYTEKIDNSKCTLGNANLAAELSKSLTTGEKTSFASPSFSIIASTITSAKDAANALMYGFDSISGKYTTITGNTATIADRQIVYFDLPLGKSADPAKSTSRFRAILVSSQDISTSPIKLTWNGAFKDSLKGIRAVVDSQTGQSWRLSASYSEYDTSSVGTISTPLLLPGIKKYANMIAKMEKKNHGVTTETEQLKVYLSKINAINFAKLLMGGIESRVLKLASGIKGKSADISPFIKNIKDISIEVNKLLEKTRKELNSSNLTEKFREIEKDQRITSMKTQR